ncbi:MAG: hypothetical protein ACLP8Y_01175 [Thermoplasmata archaeon]
MNSLSGFRLSSAFRYLRNPIVLFVLVNIPFLFLFYDVWNLNTIFYAASYLAIGLNPYQYHNLITGGLLIQFLGLTSYYTFRWSGSNYLLSASLIKLLYLSLTYLTGLVLSRVAKFEGLAYHRKILYAFIFNPFLLFVNNVWIETDVIIVFLYVLGYAALYYGWDRGGEHRYLVFGVLCISLGIFSYYSIALIVPTLILYRETLRKKLELLVVFLAIGGLLSIPLLAFDLTSLGTALGGLQSPGTQLDVYSIFQLISPISADRLAVIEKGALAVIVGSSIVVPVVLKRLGAKEPVSLLTSYAVAYLVFVNTVQGDNLVLLTGLILLALISFKESTLSYKRIFLLQLFILPQFLVAELLDGIGPSTGVFYWSFYQFHAAPDLFSLLGGVSTWHFLLVAYFVSLCLTLGYFLVRGTRRHPGAAARLPRSAPSMHSSPGPRNLPRVMSTATVIALVLLAGVVPALVLWDPNVGKPSGTLSGFDAGQFVPLEYGSECIRPPECAYQLSSSDSFQVNGSSSSAYFANSSTPIGLFRNMTNQQFTINFTASIPLAGNDSTTAMDLVNTSSFFAGLRNALIVNNSSLLTPAQSNGSVSIVEEPNPALSGTDTLFHLNGAGVRTYFLNPKVFLGRQMVFGAELTTNAQNQNLLWDIFGMNSSYEGYLRGNTFYLGYKESPTSGWVLESFALNLPLNRWFTAGFDVDPMGDYLTGFVDDHTLSLPYLFRSTPEVSLNIGKFNASNLLNGQFSVSGLVTNLYALPSNNTHYAQLAYAWSSLSNRTTVVPASDYLTVTIVGGSERTTLALDGTDIPVGPIHDLWLGKLSDSGLSVSLAFGEVAFSSSSSGPNLELVVLDFGVLIPAVLSLWTFYRPLDRWLRSRARGS